jgi:predicted phosphodiesterase
MHHILVLSDTHLNKNFEQAKLDKLVTLIQGARHVIINGDFWEGFEMTFDEFMRTKWVDLFPYLKSKHAVYIFGNHDKCKFSDQRIDQFCDRSTEQYIEQINTIRFIFEHGHRYAHKLDGMFGVERPHRIEQALVESIQMIAIKLFGTRAMWFAFKGLNQEIKRKAKEEFGKLGPYRLISGHTHCAEVDTARNFANTGFSKYGYLQYLTIDEKGIIKKHLERY